MEIKYDYKALERAIKNNPKVVAQETKDFLYRAEKRLESKTGSQPWRVGSNGGGSPVATGNLLRAHEADRKPFYLRWFVNTDRAKYAEYVHGGTKNMKGRPWLRWVENESEKQIQEDAQRLVKNITDALGK
jgi:hypothetical protein